MSGSNGFSGPDKQGQEGGFEAGSGSMQAREVLGSLIEAYQRVLREHPVATKAVTSLVGFAIGDRIAQSIGGGTCAGEVVESTPGSPTKCTIVGCNLQEFMGDEDGLLSFLTAIYLDEISTGAGFDALRFARMSAYGVMIDGPVGHFFYQFLDRKIFPEDPKSTQAVLAKTAIDQCIWAPLMTCVFLAFLTTLEGRPDVSVIMSVIQAKLVPIMLANFTVWPLAHLVNFRFVPPEQRILFNNIVAIGWTTYLSFTCGSTTGGMGEMGGSGGSPRDVLTLAAGLPCVAATADVLSHANAHTLEVVREMTAMNDVVIAWGVDGLTGGRGMTGSGGGTEVLMQYFKLKNEALSAVCRP